ncbi:MAG: sensor histidine kinase [Tepidisphaeraceae bacterium]
MAQTVNEVESAGEALEESVAQRLRDAQEQIAFLREQLTQTQRLATIGTIAAVIAHEFNNILTPVISYSQYALQSATSEKPDHELIKKALNKSYLGATKAGRICTSMLGLARGESDHGLVSVQTLVDETLLVLARDPSKDGIAVRVQVQPELHVVGDMVQLEQVLLNLLINARQAMIGKAGSITIKAAAPDDGACVRLSVIDTGPGIAPKHLDKIFEPFFTTKGTARRGESRGTGLGLSICREIIDAHHGQIEVTSELGRGTTFHITLPKVDPKSGAPESGAANSGAAKSDAAARV